MAVKSISQKIIVACFKPFQFEVCAYLPALLNLFYI